MDCSSALCFILVLNFVLFASAIQVSHTNRAITIDGQPRILLSGSIHYPRSTPQVHANLDLIRFLKTIQDQGLYAVLRIGPYVCAEWNYGGFPVWLHNLPGIELRTLNSVFMNEMQNFTTLIVDMVKKENLFASQGDPHRTSEDLAFSVARFYQLGGTFQNYYMYHGGTNFDRMAGGPYITTSYDYDAPLDEYGNLNQPKYGHLKQLHDALMSIEKPLVSGDVNTTDLGNSVSISKYTTKEASACFFSNANVTTDATVSYNGKDFKIPAWSVSILPDCQTEVYNTAKVNTQTSVMVKKENKAEEEPAALKWLWRPENLDATARLGKGQVSANMLLDQKAAANDASDYLWYMTSVHLKKADRIWSNDMTLRINGSGHVLHAFVNGEHIGSQWASYGIFTYFMERQVKLKPGKNIISLLSATVGYQNYGPFFDMIQSGIPGPVELIGRNGDETLIKDLSSHKWTYEIGLHGFENRLFSSDSRFAAKWQSENLPVNKMMTWYKTTFKAPLGTDPVALDLQGLGKGVAWVNGHNLGRYWPSFIAEEGCSLDPCDYRGAYDNNKCVSNCGHPTQRWYHVPRSFINDGDNTLVLFEEFGGNPSLVNFKTISMEKACAHAYDNHRFELSCQGRQISGIAFASYGNPLGSCGSFTTGECKSQNDALKIVENLCVGKESCAIDVSEATFGATDCAADLVKRLAVEALC
ncbi:Beta-galactosidase 7, partial [Cucurbita argyrosperma subsp. sororia]